MSEKSITTFALVNKMIHFEKYNSSFLPDAEAIFHSNVPDFLGAGELDYMYRFLEEDIKDSRHHYWMLLVDGVAAGMCGVYIDPLETEAVLCWGLLHKNYHRKNFGKEMLLYRIDYIRKQTPQATIICRTSQVTEGFFAKFGFKTTEVKENYWAEGLHLYKMELKP